MIHHFSKLCVKNALQFVILEHKKAETLNVSALKLFLFVCFNQTILTIITFVYDAGPISF